MRQIVFTAHRTAALIEAPDPAGPLEPHEIRGRTLVSLVSPGTELNGGFLGSDFPWHPGYACVFEVEQTGGEVRDLAPGTAVFASGKHCSHQQTARRDAVPLPAGLAPEAAVFARLAGVSMSTLNTTRAHPPAHVLITGLGPVGNLAAQVFHACGYTVTAVDPAASRRASATRTGLRDVRASLTEGTPSLDGLVALHVECSGHEQAALDGCRLVAKGGEVVLVGVPWQRRTELFAHDLLHAVFHRYAVLRSGWEWQVPAHPANFQANSLTANYAAALAWLADGRLRVEGMAGLHSPRDAQKVYTGLAAQSLPEPSALFDWRLL